MSTHSYLLTVDTEHSFRATWSMLDKLLSCYTGRTGLPFKSLEVLGGKKNNIYSLLKKFKVEGKGITTEEKIILNLFVIYLQQQGI